MAKRCKRYEEVTSEALGQKAATTFTYRAEPTDDPAEIVFTGACPRCDGAMTYTWPLTVIRSIGPAEDAAELEAMGGIPDDALSIPVLCTCTREHPGADGAKGCGAFWRLSVPRPS